jgi:hypothetical protein
MFKMTNCPCAMQYTHQTTDSRKGSQIPDLLHSRGLICYVRNIRASKTCSLRLPPYNQLLQWLHRRRTCYAIFTPNITKSEEMWNKRITETGTDLPSSYVRTPLFVSIFRLSHSLPFLLCSFLIYIFMKVELYNRRKAPEHKIADSRSFIRISCYESCVWV